MLPEAAAASRKIGGVAGEHPRGDGKEAENRHQQ